MAAGTNQQLAEKSKKAKKQLAAREEEEAAARRATTTKQQPKKKQIKSESLFNVSLHFYFHFGRLMVPLSGRRAPFKPLGAGTLYITKNDIFLQNDKLQGRRFLYNKK